MSDRPNVRPVSLSPRLPFRPAPSRGGADPCPLQPRSESTRARTRRVSKERARVSTLSKGEFFFRAFSSGVWRRQTIKRGPVASPPRASKIPFCPLERASSIVSDRSRTLILLQIDLRALPKRRFLEHIVRLCSLPTRPPFSTALFISSLASSEINRLSAPPSTARGLRRHFPEHLGGRR